MFPNPQFQTTSAILCNLLESPVLAWDERNQTNWQFLSHNGFNA
jgi:hypothetical protein